MTCFAGVIVDGLMPSEVVGYSNSQVFGIFYIFQSATMKCILMMIWFSILSDGKDLALLGVESIGLIGPRVKSSVMVHLLEGVHGCAHFFFFWRLYCLIRLGFSSQALYTLSIDSLPGLCYLSYR